MSRDHSKIEQEIDIQSGSARLEIDALRTEVLRLRRQERRYLTELAKFAQMAENKRTLKGSLTSRVPRLKSVLKRRNVRNWILEWLPERVKIVLRRIRARYFA